MEPRYFIEEFTGKDKKRIIIRTIDVCDTGGLLKFINDLVDEDAPIEINHKTDYASESEYTANKVKSLIFGNEISIVAVDGEDIAGEADIKNGNGRSYGIGNIGISIAKEYRGIGLGLEMMNVLLRLSKNSGEYRIATLDVFSNNLPAKNLYEKIGFKVAGVVPKFCKIGNSYVDDIRMYKEF